MRKFILAFSLSALCSVAAWAQTVGSDHKKGEFYIGYSNGQVDTGIDSGGGIDDVFRDRANFHGVNVSGVYNVGRYFGVKGDVSATFNKTRFADSFTDPTTGTTFTTSFDTKNSLYNAVGGVQVKDNSREGTFKPFAHAMAGLAHARTNVSNVVCTPPADCPVIEDSFGSNGLSMIFGGGLDFRLNNSIQIRAIQVDYNPVRIFGGTDHNLRLGAGIVF